MEKFLVLSKKIKIKGISSEVTVTTKKIIKNKNNFIIYLTDKIDQSIQYDLCYFLSKTNIIDSNTITTVRKIDKILINRINNDFANIDKNILYYLGKFPGFGKDIDGGSILANLLIDTLKVRCNLTVNFIRKNNEIFNDDKVKEINYFAYKNSLEYKFDRRLKNLDTNFEALKDFDKFDKIIVQHTSKLFGMDKCGSSFWSKSILIPMFCTSSYKRAGEIVPDEYFRHEKFVIQHVQKIISPSETEALDLVKDYSIERDKINVVNRTISPLIHYQTRKTCKKPTNLICIGSIKKQKNNMDQLRLLNLLLAKGYNVNLHLPTTIQDQDLFMEMNKYIAENNLKDHVFFHYSISQKDLGELLRDMDINISTANWETFGCGIFEGVVAGLPTVIYKKIKVVKEVVNKNHGLLYVNNVEEMSKCIERLINDADFYRKANKSLLKLLPSLSFKKEANSFVSIILDN